MISLKIAFAYVKKYWYIIAGVVGFIVVEVILQKRNDGLTKLLEEIQKQHEQELKDIQHAHDVEEQQHQQNVLQLEQRLSEIEKQYQQAQQQLDDKKRAEITQILQDTANNPDELAKKLSEATGFAVVLPDVDTSTDK